MTFEALYSVAPFWRGRLAHGILVAEEADLLNCFVEWHGLQPLNWDEVFAELLIGDMLCEVIATLGNFQHEDLTLISFNCEA